jgi:hypothetical protein
MTGAWANNDEIASSGIFEAVHSGLTVQLIATPRAQLMTCKADEPASLALGRNTERYDHLPVLDLAAGEERIVGLFNASIFFNAPTPDGQVRNHMLPLAEEYLIGADKPCRLVLAGARIAGLVSLSDLQKIARSRGAVRPHYRVRNRDDRGDPAPLSSNIRLDASPNFRTQGCSAGAD